jgi:hypothetical protein
MPCGEESRELFAAQRLSGLEKLVTESTFHKPMSDARPTVQEAGWLVVATREESDEDESTLG